MSSQTAIVDGFLEAFARRDLEGLLQCLEDRVYFVVSSGDEIAPRGGDFSGHAGFRRWWEREVPDDFELRPIQIEQIDETHIFAALYAGRPENGGWLCVSIACIYTVRSGKIEAIELFADSERAYERARRSVPVVAEGPEQARR